MVLVLSRQAPQGGHSARQTPVVAKRPRAYFVDILRWRAPGTHSERGDGQALQAAVADARWGEVFESILCTATCIACNSDTVRGKPRVANQSDTFMTNTQLAAPQLLGLLAQIVVVLELANQAEPKFYGA